MGPLEEVLTSQDGSNNRRMNIQDLIRHTMSLRGADAPPGTVPRGNLTRELRKAISSEKGKGKRKKGASPHVSDGSNKLSPPAQRLMNRWKDRMHRVSLPPRSNRESELIASLITANREPGSCLRGST